MDENLAVLDAAPAVLQVQRAGTDGFDLRTKQFNAGFKLLLHEIIVIRLSVLCGDFDAFLFRVTRLLC